MPASREEHERWAQAAQTYDAEHRSTVGEALENEMRSWLARQFTDADEVLELGCGTGIFSAMIAERVKHLTATDLSPEMLEQARQRLGAYENVELRKEDAYQTSFADSSFSAVLAANLLHHADAPAAVVRECRRVLTPGGRVVVIDCVGHGSSLWSWIGRSFAYLRRRGQPEEGHHHFSPDGLAALITAGGFVVQETTLVRQRRPRMKFVCLRAESRHQNPSPSQGEGSEGVSRPAF
jgi:ubiquinone/menaquinone biosynthesis C-methylase UbiE